MHDLYKKKNMKNPETIASGIAEKIRQAADELEEFRLQLALGKANASDKFEEMKKDFRGFVSGVKEKLEKIKDFGGQKAVLLKIALEELQLQLMLGKAEARVHFEIQEKKILAAIQKAEKALENMASEAGVTPELMSDLNQEMTKIRIKLKILRLKFELKKMDIKGQVKDHLEEHLKSLKRFADTIKSGTKEKEDQNRWKHFHKEVDEAFEHLKKAFAKP
jgi:hypothetical protein